MKDKGLDFIEWPFWRNSQINRLYYASLNKMWVTQTHVITVFLMCFNSQRSVTKTVLPISLKAKKANIKKPSPHMCHLRLQVLPQRIMRVRPYKRHRSIIGPAKLSRFPEGHRWSNIHITSVKDLRPSWWTFTIQYSLIIQMERKNLNFQQLWIIVLIHDSRSHRNRFVVGPVVVSSVNLGLPDLQSAAGKQKSY